MSRLNLFRELKVQIVLKSVFSYKLATSLQVLTAVQVH